MLDTLATRAREIWAQLMWAERPGPFWAPLNLLVMPLRLVWLTVILFRASRLGVHASGLAFYLLLSIVPVLAFLFLVFKVFQVPSMVKPFLLEVVTGGNAVLIESISGYIENAQAGALGGVGALTLFVVGFLVLQRVKIALNLIWRVERLPGYGSRLIEYTAVLVITPILLMAAFSVSTYLEGRKLSGLFPGLAAPGGLPMGLANFSTLAVFVLVVLYAYWVLPDTRVRLPAALLGALVAGTALRIVQNFYIQFMIEMSNYNLVYGAMAFLPFLMVWFFLAALIFIFGAQLSCTVQNYALFMEQQRVTRRGGERLPQVVLLVLAALLRILHDSGRAVPRRAIVRESELPASAVDDALSRLTEGALITPVQGNSHSYVPQGTTEGWTVGEVLERLELMPRFAEGSLFSGSTDGTALRKAFREANRAMARPLGKVTLHSLFQGAGPAGGLDGEGEGEATTRK